MPGGKPKRARCCCGFNPCCPDRCNPVADEVCDNPLPETMTCTLTVSTVKNDPITGLPTGCYSVTGTLFLSPIGLWIGFVEGTCSGWCGDSERLFQYEVRVMCGTNPDGRRSWFIEIADNTAGDLSRTCIIPTFPIVWSELESSCDPILLSGQSTPFECNDLACVIPILDIDEFFGEVIFNVLITEDPP